MKRFSVICLLFLLVAAIAKAEPPLFTADDTVALTVTAPMRDLIRSKHRK